MNLKKEILKGRKEEAGWVKLFKSVTFRGERERERIETGKVRLDWKKN